MSEKIPMFLIVFEERAEVGPRDEPSDDGPYSGYSDTLVEVSNFQLYRTNSFYPDLSNIEHSDYQYLSNQAAYDFNGPFVAVVNLFTDGGTFGQKSGYVEFCGVFLASDEKAIDVCVKEAGDRDYGYFGSRDDTLVLHFDEAPFLKGRLSK